MCVADVRSGRMWVCERRCVQVCVCVYAYAYACVRVRVYVRAYVRSVQGRREGKEEGGTIGGILYRECERVYMVHNNLLYVKRQGIKKTNELYCVICTKYI